MNWQLLSLVTLLLIPSFERGEIATVSVPRDVFGGRIDGRADGLQPAERVETINFDSVSVGLSSDSTLSIVIPIRDSVPRLRDDGPNLLDFHRGGFERFGDTVIMPVTFRPIDIGFREAHYIVTEGDMQGDSIVVTGIGDRSFVITHDSDTLGDDTIHFPPTLVGDSSFVDINVQNNTQTIQNVSLAGNVTTTTAPFSRGELGRSGASQTPPGLSVLPVTFRPADLVSHVETLTIETPFGYRRFVLVGQGIAPEMSVGHRVLQFLGPFIDPDTCRLDSFQIVNTGTAPLHVDLDLVGGTPGTFTIVSPVPSDSIELDIRESQTVVIQYCGLSADNAVVVITSDALINSRDSVALLPVGRVPVREPGRLVADPDSLKFGDFASDSCLVLDVLIRNAGDDTVSIQSFGDSITGGTVTSVIPGQVRLPHTLDSGESLLFSITLCPSTTGTIDGFWYVVSVSGDTTWVAVSGRRQLLPVEIHLDSTSRDVGETFALRARLDSDIPRRSAGRYFRLQIRFDPKALYVVDAVDPVTRQNWILTRSGTDPGLLRLDYSSDEGFNGTLVEISFRGLSTGQEENLVEIEEFFVGLDSVKPDPAITTSIGAPGLVELIGCNIGEPTGLDRRATIRGLSINGSEALLRYIAPAGSSARLTLTDINGSAVHVLDLPVSTSGEQSVPVDLTGVPPGFYILDLRVGDGRSTLPLMISR